VSVTTEHCDDMALERVRFFPRQLIGADDLTTEQTYQREKLRRHNRYLHGWGVVCGFDVRPAPEPGKPWQVRICPGYLLGPQGDEVCVGTEALFDVETCVMRSSDPCAFSRPCPPVSRRALTDRKLHLAIRSVTCEARPVRVAPVGCACEDVECEYSRLRDGYELCCLSALPETHAPRPYGCAALCDHDSTFPCPVCPSDPWVVLATISLPETSLVDLTVTDVDPISHRRILYSAAMLQELALCLCADGEAPSPTPSPTPTPPATPSPSPTPSPTPTPTPEPGGIPPRIAAVSLASSSGAVTLAKPTDTPSLIPEFEANAIEITFADSVVDPLSVVVGSSFLVEETTSQASVAGSISWLTNNVMRFELASGTFFDVGSYRVTLRGDDPAIRSTSGARLDGDSKSTWPVGDGVAGGNYAFTFAVARIL
jgi:hypothetical protein